MRLVVLVSIIFVSQVEGQIKHLALQGQTPWQDGRGEWFHQLYNISGGAHRFGQPNAHQPWKFPGGVIADSNEERSELIWITEYFLPENPKVYNKKGVLPTNLTAPNNLIAWKFPVGTGVRLRLFDNGYEFANHISVKIKDGDGIDNWIGEEVILGKLPNWYKSPENCIDCHLDVGKHANILRPNEHNYYGWLRGSDGRFRYPKIGNKP